MRAYDVIQKKPDLTSLVWSESGQTSASGGTFLKARVGIGAQATYYKLSCYDSYRGIYGHECVNELIAARLMALLDVPHVEYRLVHADMQVDGVRYDTWLARSKSFRKQGERKIAFDMFFDLMHQPGESQFDFCERYGWSDDIQHMMLVDYLIINRDRHGANIEVLRDRSGNLRLAPLFDNGVSLVFSCYGDEDCAAAFDALADRRVNNFIGSRSLEENLRFVAPDVVAGSLQESDRSVLLAGLDSVLPQAHLDAIWNIVWQRWQRWLELARGSAVGGDRV